MIWALSLFGRISLVISPWFFVITMAVILGAGALLVVLGRAIDAAPETGASRAVRPMLAWLVLATALLLTESRAGVFSAAVGLFTFFVWLELVLDSADMGLVVVGYTIVTLAGMAQFGKDEWRRRGDS